MTHFISHFDDLVSLENDQTTSSGPMDIWVRGEEVSVYEVEMPEVPQRKWIDMIPWLLEDQLLRSAEELHFVLGPELQDNKVLVYVVSKECMNRWIMMADSKSVNAQKFTPDFLALPIPDGHWTLSIQGARLLVRTGHYQGFVTDITSGWQLLELHLDSTEDVRVAALVEDESLIPESWRDRVQIQKGELNWGFIELPQVNLLSGEYRPTTAKELKPWFPSIGFGAGALVMLLLYMLVQSYQWQKDVAVIDAGIVAAYEDLFNERWRGSRSAIRSAADERLQLLQHQYISLQSTPLVELRAIDSGLSGCAGCDVQLIEQEDGFVSVTLKPADNLKSRLNSSAGVKLEWGNPNEEGVVRLKVASEANGG